MEQQVSMQRRTLEKQKFYARTRLMKNSSHSPTKRTLRIK